MKGKGRFILVFAACLAAVLFLCGTAGAGGQTNPRRQHVEETIQWREQEGPERYLASLKVTCDRKPTLAEPGKFTVTINNVSFITDIW